MPKRKLYEFDPDWVIAPSETLREWIDKMGLRTVQVAAACAGKERKEYVAQLLQDVLDRKPLTNEHALALQLVTSVSAQFWCNYEHNYRVGLAAGKKDISDGL